MVCNLWQTDVKIMFTVPAVLLMYFISAAVILLAARDARRITAAEIKYMRTAGYIWTDYKRNAEIAKELKKKHQF